MRLWSLYLGMPRNDTNVRSIKLFLRHLFEKTDTYPDFIMIQQCHQLLLDTVCRVLREYHYNAHRPEALRYHEWIHLCFSRQPLTVQFEPLRGHADRGMIVVPMDNPRWILMSTTIPETQPVRNRQWTQVDELRAKYASTPIVFCGNMASRSFHTPPPQLTHWVDVWEYIGDDAHAYTLDSTRNTSIETPCPLRERPDRIYVTARTPPTLHALTLLGIDLEFPGLNHYGLQLDFEFEV